MFAETLYYYAKVTASDGTVSWLKIETEWNSSYSRYDTFKGDWRQRDIKGELDFDEVYTGSGGTGTKMTFKEIGSGAFYNFSGLTSVKGTSIKELKNQAFDMCSSLKSINFPNLERMDENAFANCTSLVSYTIPASVTYINGAAFYGSTNLTSLTVNSNNYYFSCENNILYNKNKTVLYAFLSCRTDESYVVPSTVKTIGEKAFYNNKYLKSVVLSNGLETISQSAFSNSKIESVFIPQSVNTIKYWAFLNCNSLTSVKVAKSTPIKLTNNVFPSTTTLYVPQGSKEVYSSSDYWKDVAEIKEYSPSPVIPFADATVKSICVTNWDYDGDGELSEEEALEINEIGTQFQNKTDISSFDELQYFTNLKHIAASAFSGCTNLASIKFPASLTTIGYNAFLNTAWLNAQPDGLVYVGNVLYAYKGTMPQNTKIVVKDGTVSICDYTFNNKNNLIEIELPNSLVSIGSELEGYVFYGCTGLTAIKIPAGVKNIVRYTFASSGLKTVELPENLESIGNSAFRSCTSLETFVFPDKVRTIGKNTFRGCTNLKSVTMPSYLMSVASDAFRDCNQLARVDISNLGGWCNIDFTDARANPLYFAHHLYVNGEELVDFEMSSNCLLPYFSPFSNTWVLANYNWETIKPYVFYGCQGLKTVSIAKDIKSIGNYAFSNCSSLYTAKVETAPFDLNTYAFPTRSSVTLYTPQNYLNQYQAAEVWKTFKSIKGYPNVDVNSDENVDVVDVVDIVRYTKGTPSDSFDKYLADLNSDKVIDLNDANQDLNAVSYSTVLTTISPESGEQANSVRFGNFEVRARKTCNVGIILKNASDKLVGFQMDVTVPDGLSLSSNMCRLSNRIADKDQQLIVNSLGNNTYRFTSVSLSLQPITGNDGELITLSLDATNLNASGNMSVSNIRFVTDISERIVMQNDVFEVQPVENLQFSGGDGTENNPYLILDPNDFANIANDVNGGTSYEGVFFKVAKPEIDFNGVSYTAIGKKDYISNKEVINAFSGTFDGNNVIIKNLTMTEALFGYVGQRGVVSNIVVDESCKIDGTTSNTAGIAASNEGTIDNCINKAPVSSSKYHVGGICGDNMGTISNCKNYGSITGVSKESTDVPMMGGIAGDLDNGKIINCQNYGAVSSPGFQIGGIVGLVTDNTCTIENCVNKGNVTGAWCVGGLIGSLGISYNRIVTIENNLVSGCTIFATDGNGSSYNVGAISGGMTTSAKNNFYTDDVIVRAGNTVYDGNTPRGVWSYDTSTNSYVPKDISENCAAKLLVPGSVETPFTCAEAIAFVSGLTADEATETEYYIKGKVCAMQENFSYKYGNATFRISDDGTDNGSFTIFRTKYFEGNGYAGGRVPNIGDEVVLCGKLINYQGTTPETASNRCRLVSLNNKTVGTDLEVGELFVAKTPEDVEMFFVVDNFGMSNGKTDVVGCSVGYAVGNRPETYTNAPACIAANYEGAITIPETAGGFPVQAIAPSAFVNTRITSVSMPASIWDIETRAFSGCTQLASVNLPQGVTLNASTFENCTSLTSVVLPKSVTLYAMSDMPIFKGCTNLTSITVNDETPFVFPQDDVNYLVDDPSKVTLNVPAGSVSAYQAAECWKKFKEIKEFYISPAIAFADANVKAVCVAHWDTNNDGELSESEAAEVTSLGNAFMDNKAIKTFDEISYFTGVKALKEKEFLGCTGLERFTLPGWMTLDGYSIFSGCTSLKTVTFISNESGNSYNQNFHDAATDIQFVIPEGTAEDFLRKGYVNLSDKGALDILREEFEAEEAAIARMPIDNTVQTVMNQALASVNEATDYAPIFNQISVIKQAAKEFVTTTTLKGEVDVTGAYITNPDFDHFDIGWKTPTGWITAGYKGDGHCENGDVVMDKFIELWSYDELGDYQFSQTLSQLPAGTYRLEADAIASWREDGRDISGAYLYIGDQQKAVANQGAEPKHYTVEFVNAETKDIEIGMKTMGTNANWIAADNFRLYYIGDETENAVEATDISKLTDAVYSNAANGSKGTTARLSISLKNAKSTNAYSFDLVLPDGVTLATDDKGDYICSLSNRHNGQTPTINNKSTGVYSFAVFSLSGSELSDNDGVILTLKVNIADNVDYGDYAVKIQNAKYSLPSGAAKVAMPETVGVLTVANYLKGDVNGDGDVDIADAVCIVNHVVGKPTPMFVAAAADVNGDGDIDIADAVRIVNLVVGKISALARQRQQLYVTLPEPE